MMVLPWLALLVAAPGPVEASEAPVMALRQLCGSEDFTQLIEAVDAEQAAKKAEVSALRVELGELEKKLEGTDHGKEELKAEYARTQEMLTRREVELDKVSERYNAIASGPGSLKALCDKQPWAIDALGGLDEAYISTLPPSYFKSQSIDVCELTTKARRELTNYSVANTLDRSCEVPSGSPAMLAAAALPIVQGLGDFIQARGKDEIYDYALEQFGNQLCEGFPDPSAPVPAVIPSTKPAFLLQGTCGVFFPNGTGEKSAFRTIRNVRLRSAISDDLGRLPGRLLRRSADGQTDATTGVKEPAGYVAPMLVEALGSAFSAGNSSKPPPEIARDWAQAVREQWKREFGTSICAIDDSRCGALLVLSVVDASTNYGTGHSMIAHAIEDGVGRYCRDFVLGDAYDSDHPAACIFENEAAADGYASQWHERLVKAVDVGQGLQRLGDSVAKAREAGTSSQELVARFYPELRDVLLPLIKSLSDGVLWADSSEEAKLGRAAVEVSISIAARDYGNIVDAAIVFMQAQAPGCGAVTTATSDGKTAVGVPEPQWKARRLERKAVKSARSCQRSVEKSIAVLAFAADLAQAETREQATKIIEDAAAPRGTARMKYGRGSTTVTVNAHLGYLLGGQTRFAPVDDITGQQRATQAGAFRLAAPVGLDVTFPFRWDRFHLGLLVAVIDPLALSTIDQRASTNKPTFGSVLTPGILPRVGIFGSPFSVIGGVTYSPFLRSSEDCRSSLPCWTGVVQYSVGLAVDVPLLVVR